jgi:hypothetical protein
MVRTDIQPQVICSSILVQNQILSQHRFVWSRFQASGRWLLAAGFELSEPIAGWPDGGIVFNDESPSAEP